MFLRKYPVERPSSAPSTGTELYKFLMRNCKIPAASNHTIWYSGQKAKLEHPEEYAFRGNLPRHHTLELVTLSKKSITETAYAVPTDHRTVMYTFIGHEGPVYVSDLAESARKELRIPNRAKPDDKVYNPNYKEYRDLDEHTRYSNEVAAMSLPKSISGYFGARGNLTYSEKDVLDFLTTCFQNLNSPEMKHVLNGNHQAWSALAYEREKGNVEGQIMAEFFAQQPIEFYMNDFGTVVPAMFFAVATIGQDPIQYYNMLDIEVDGAKDAAQYMRQFRPQMMIDATQK